MAIIYHGVGGGVPRKTAKIFASDAATNDVTEFGSTLAGDPTPVTDIADIQNEAYETGWRDAVISDLNYPLMGDMNAVQKVASQQIAYVLQHGVPEYDANTEYNTYDIVNNQGVLYISIQDVNKNHQLSDGNWWSVYFDPNATNAKRDIGEVVFSLLPLSSTDLHLADGAVLQKNGIYVEFCDYIADLYASGDAPACFCTETEWQAAVTANGACGKFVYDEVNSTVRLPKLTGITEGTLDVSELGEFTAAGLPSIAHTHTFSGTTAGMNRNNPHSHSYLSPSGQIGGGVPSAAWFVDASWTNTGNADIAHEHDYSGTTSQNSSVNSIYGTSNTVQPKTIKGYYYICVANTVATDYTIQLDNIVTDLASKVDRTGDTMTGNLMINAAIPLCILKNTALDKTSTTAPSSDIVSGFQVQDKNGNYISNLLTMHDAVNNFYQGLDITRTVNGSTNNATFGIYLNAQNQDFAYASAGVKQNITNWSFPSNRYDDLALGASGSQYTAPADGYVYVAGTQYASSGYIFLSNDASGMQVVSQPTNVSTFEVRCIMPLAKGQQYTIIYGDLYVNVFKFVYAIGG